MNAPDKITEIKGAATAIAAIITGLIGWAPRRRPETGTAQDPARDAGTRSAR